MIVCMSVCMFSQACMYDCMYECMYVCLVNGLASVILCTCMYVSIFCMYV